MSLVNKMLKDLEKNHQQQGDDGAYQEGSGGPPPPPVHKSRRLLYASIIATVVIIVLVVAAVIKFRQQPATTPAVTQQQTTATATDNSAEPANTSIKKATASAPSQQTPAAPPSAEAKSHDEQSTITTSDSTNSAKEQQSTDANPQPATLNTEHNPPAAANPQPAPSDHQASDNMTGNPPQEDKTAQQIRIDQPPLNEKQLLTNQYNEAMEEIHDGHNDQAINRLSNLLQQAPSYKNARVSLAALLIQQQKIDQATHILKDGLNHHPKDPDYVKLYAHILVQQGQTGDALKLLTEAKANSIDADPSYFALMASLYMQQQDYRNAKNIYQHLVVKQPLNGTWWAGLGIAADKLGLTMEARKAFSRANKIGGLPPSLQKYIDKEASALEP